MKYPQRIFKNLKIPQKEMRNLFLDRNQIKKDNLVIISGRRGVGKTTLALKLAMGFTDPEKIQENYTKSGREDILKNYTPFNMEDNLVFTKKEMESLVMNQRKGIILNDESIVGVSRRNSMTKDNKNLMRTITINRKNLNTIFLLLPSVEDIDVSILQYASMWLHVDSRGVAVLMLPSKQSVFGRAAWDVQAMKKLNDSVMVSNPRIKQMPYWIYPNFYGYILFNKLSPKVEEKYLEIANRKKNLEAVREEEEKTKAKASKNIVPDNKKEKLLKIANNLISGQMTDSAELYSQCKDLEYSKMQLNKHISETLASLGDGRSPAAVIKDNREKKLETEKRQQSVIKMR